MNNETKNAAGAMPAVLAGETNSPEVTSNWHCPNCANRVHFVGYDDFGYGGPAECEGDREECVCFTTLRQALTVDADGEIDYHEFTGGSSEAEIGSYTRIQCGDCGFVIWQLPAVRITDGRA